MAARWYFSVEGGEAGPVTFQELAALARAGELDRAQMVRRDVGTWMRADSVIGLFEREDAAPSSTRVAPAPTASMPGVAPHTPTAAPMLHASSPTRPARAGKERIAWSVVLAILLSTTAAGLWRYRISSRFPEPSAAAAPPTALAVRPARPLVASVPGLAPLTPHRVPGLEKLRGAFSPCLTADLNTIVFADWKGRATEYDLYIARRGAVDKPFAEPELIPACATPMTESCPALSADGFELVYLSSDDAPPGRPPKLLRATRESGGAPFCEPSEVRLPGFGGVGQRLLAPQWLDAYRLKVNTVDSARKRSVRVATRRAGSPHFMALDSLGMDNAWPLWFFSSDTLRAYGGTADGISLCHRKSFDEAFGAPAVAASATRLGAIDGPIWVAPQEDVVFYCSAGPGNAPNEGRYLWMVAF